MVGGYPNACLSKIDDYQRTEEPVTETVKIVANLYAHQGAELALRDFETAAADIMSRYGGKIEVVVKPTQALHGARVPTEIHVVSFPTLSAYELYRSDPDLERIASLRERAIETTEVFLGTAGDAYDVD